MLSSHSHSGSFCLHAKSTLEEIISSALAKNFHTYSLTEHIPRKSQFYYPEEPPSTNLSALFLSFITTAKSLRAQHTGKIKILIGLETEYIEGIPSEITTINTLVSTHTLDFVVTSIHHINTIPIDFSALLFQTALEQCPSYEALITSYLDRQHDLISGISCPQVIGHFDLYRLYGGEIDPTPELWLKITRNIELIVRVNALVEINTRAWKKGLRDPYPCREIVKVWL
jgi:histidinol-phosphatase (PHP family)